MDGCGEVTVKGQPQREWTKPLLVRCAQRALRGEKLDDIAASLSPPASGVALRKAWRRVLGEGFGAAVYRARTSVAGRHIKVMGWRADEDLTYAECCERLGWEPTKVNQNKLRNGLIRFCRRTGIKYPQSPRGHKHRSFRHGRSSE